MNTFGTLYRLTTFGESHGAAIGGIIDGIPANVTIDLDAVQYQLDRRRPGQSSLTSPRKEPDRLEILSGMKDGRTLGTPIGFLIRNTNQRSGDYDELEAAFRPCHADYTYQAKYGIRDHRGGGRASARTTASIVVGGAFARQVLEAKGIAITSRVTVPEDMESAILAARAAQDTIGGIIECTISGLPAGVGEPVADKLSARLAQAMLSINAAKGFDFGSGFEGATLRGSELVDEFMPNPADGTVTNHSGGIQGGISNGMDVNFRVVFKPIATLPRFLPKDADGHPVGRHDVCVLPRALPIVEAMAAMAVLDLMMIDHGRRF